MSGWFLSGAEGILPQSDTEAYLWARRAAEQGLVKAIYAIGYYSEQGIGVRADLEESKRWYLTGSKLGHQKSSQRLLDLKKGKTPAIPAPISSPSTATAGAAMPNGRDENCIVM